MLAGCETSTTTGQTEYTLQSVNGAAPPVANVKLTLSESDLYGTGPVNLWQGSIQNNKVGPIITTRRGGTPEEMEFESGLIQLLEGSSMETDGDELVFTKGEKTVTFTQSAN